MIGQAAFKPDKVPTVSSTLARNTCPFYHLMIFGLFRFELCVVTMMVSGHQLIGQLINQISHYVYRLLYDIRIRNLTCLAICTPKAAASHLRIKRKSTSRRTLS
ncbi:hypothetical protein F4776DRAFT_311241 [Hypoxylon sp. NC0597]|nr:hypothetical protein F4776DRAFT_311241 [Hypoxylon sp. NC0597]